MGPFRGDTGTRDDKSLSDKLIEKAFWCVGFRDGRFLYWGVLGDCQIYVQCIYIYV